MASVMKREGFTLSCQRPGEDCLSVALGVLQPDCKSTNDLGTI